MKVAIIGEGQTEFYCVPKMAGRLGNVVVGCVWTRTVSTRFDWERFFELRVVPLVLAMLAKRPEKIVVVIDRGDRTDCSPDLAERGLTVIAGRCAHCLGDCSVSVIVSDKRFECLLFADYNRVDQLRILNGPRSHTFPTTTDSQNVLNWIKPALRRGSAYHKIRDGMFLAQGMDLQNPQVQGRNRSLRKLVHEFETI